MLNEYPAGSAFTGMVGRTTDESVPGLAPDGATGRPARPTCVIVVLDDTGFGQLGCYGSPIADAELRRARRRRPALHQHAHHRAVLAEPVLHRHRPQPPQQRHGRHHRAGHRAIRATTASIPFENGFLSEMLVEQGYNTYMVGKWHLTPEQPRDRRRAVRPLAARPRLRAVLRLPRRRHQPVVSGPGLRQPPGRAAATPGAGLPPDRGPGRQVDRSSSPTPSRSTPTSRSTCTSASVPRTRRTTSPRSGPTGTPGSSTTAGTPTGRRSSPSRRSSASFPPTPSSPGTTRTCRTGTRCPTDRAGCSAG